jgi:UDP-glucuronate decarboxylase
MSVETMKRILITGGAGFLGSHLCERLLREGNDIICLDNFFTGSKENIVHLLKVPHFELIRHDIINPIYLEVDEIYNMACPASPVHYQFNPIKTIKTNVMGVINVLGIAKRTKAKVLQASTSEIYGDPEVNPQNEAYWGKVNPIGIRSCYDEGKRAAECLMMDYRRQNSVNTKIARIFNTYGPRMAINDGRVVSNFIIQALQGKKITVYGDGTHTRSFCYADDMIEGLILLMNSADGFYGPVNIGNPEEFTILQLAQLIIQLTKSNSGIEFQPLPSDDPAQRKPDITLAKEKIGWSPKIDLERGLMSTIGYFRDVLKIS